MAHATKLRWKKHAAEHLARTRERLSRLSSMASPLAGADPAETRERLSRITYGSRTRP